MKNPQQQLTEKQKKDAAMDAALQQYNTLLFALDNLKMTRQMISDTEQMLLKCVKILEPPF